MKKTLLLIATMFCMVGFASADSEVAKLDGNGNAGVTGTVELATGSSRLAEVRNLRMDNRGAVFTRDVRYSVLTSSFITVESSTNTGLTLGVTGSTYTIANSTQMLPSPNVFAVAYPSSPVLTWFEVGEITAPVRVRLFDSRGSTGTASNCLYDRWVTSGTASVKYSCSSGVVCLVGPAARDTAAHVFRPGTALPGWGESAGTVPYIRLYIYNEKKQDTGKTP